jgi:hypothetical protein
MNVGIELGKKDGEVNSKYHVKLFVRAKRKAITVEPINPN